MPPRRYSRYTFCAGVLDEAGRLFLTEREPYRYRALPDNRQHVVKEGETLFTLAGRYYSALPRPAGLWWVIADFQPDPIHDPTLQLEPGRALIVPSLRTVLEEVFSEKRRQEASP